MHFSYSNKSIHYLNQDKHIYQDAHREKCIGVSAEHASAEHASAGTRVASASTRVPEHLWFGELQRGNIASPVHKAHGKHQILCDYHEVDNSR